MSLTGKVMLALVGVAVVPGLLAGFLSYRAAHAELAAAIGRAHREMTDEAAVTLDDDVEHVAESFRLTLQGIPFAALRPDELREVLQLPARQAPAVDVLAVVNGAGDAVVQPIVVTGRGRAELPLEAMARHVPLQAALAAGAAVSAPFVEQGAPRLVVVVRVVAEPPLLVAAGLSLVGLQRHVDALATGGDRVWLLGPDRAVLAQAGGAALDAEALGEATRLAAARGTTATVRHGEGEFLLAAAALPSLGWTLVLEKPAAVALQPAERLRTFALFWAATSLLLLLGLGWLLGRAVNQPIAELVSAAQALSGGDYARRARVSSGELGRLAEAFNVMALEIERRDAQIRRGNEELQQRVDERTAELQDAEGQILRSRHLAGLASLSAGVAHELNNPVMAVLGFIDMAREELPRDAAAQELLANARDAAQRIAAIAVQVRELVERERGDGVPFVLAESAERVLAEQQPALAAAKVTVHAALDRAASGMSGNRGELEDAIGELVKNAVAAMPAGGELFVNVAAVPGVDGVVKLVVRDTGLGIAPEHLERIYDPFFTTKPRGGELGMGLTLVHRAVEGHGGRITVQSTVGQGTTFVVVLPRNDVRAHLA